MVRVLNLYTFKPNFVCDDTNEERCEFFVQALVEAMETGDSLAWFIELKREQVWLMQKLSRDLIERTDGNYYRNHVLLDVLDIYKKYVDQFGNGSAFGTDCIELCHKLALTLFELFACATKIVVFMEVDRDPNDVLTMLLQHLADCDLVVLEKIFLLK
ncbi:p18 [Hyphantria cunea granulovirus]|uniref:P18 n=1 Tax=Hyphantria cunea granulovirus TaxID=307448 RepID=A0AAF1D294_9BBAC|nr:p18 [Hyphantria cunea granulovirus]QBQ01634.1 p18 [Hyphantria cunea granulovirus]